MGRFFPNLTSGLLSKKFVATALRYLIGRQDLKGVCDLLLPAQAVLSEDLGGGLEGFAALGQETGSQDDLVVAEGGLVVVDVGRAVGAVVAVDGVACVCSASVFRLSTYPGDVMKGEGGKKDGCGENKLTRIALVGVALQCAAALCDLEVVLGDYLVQGVCAAGQDFASVAVAQDVASGVLVEVGGPLSGTAVADSVVAGHFCCGGWCVRGLSERCVGGEGVEWRRKREARDQRAQMLINNLPKLSRKWMRLGC